MQVNLSEGDQNNGYRVTVNEDVVELPHTFTPEEAPAIVGIIHNLGLTAPNVEVLVSHDDGTWFVNGDQLLKTRYVSILEFSE